MWKHNDWKFCFWSYLHAVDKEKSLSSHDLGERAALDLSLRVSRSHKYLNVCPRCAHASVRWGLVQVFRFVFRPHKEIKDQSMRLFIGAVNV